MAKEKKKENVEDHKEMLLRTQANFENYKKQVEKRQVEFEMFAKMKVISKILPIFEHLDLALKTNPENTEFYNCLLYTSPSPRDDPLSRMPSSA